MLRLEQFPLPARISIRLLWIVGGLGLAIFTVGAAVGYGNPPSDAVDSLYTGLYVVPGALCILRAVLVRPERVAWAAFGLGMLFWGASEVYYYTFLANLSSPPYPSYSDALWLSSYACTFVGLLALMRSRLRHFRRTIWVDAVLGGLAVAGVGAALLVEPILNSTGGRFAAVATNIAYPLMDVLNISLLIAVLVTSGGRPGRGWGLLGAVFASQCLSDTLYLYQSATSGYHLGTLLDATWPLYMLLIARVAWQKPAVAADHERQGWPALVMTCAFGLVGLGLTTYGRFHRLSDVALVLATLTLIAAFVRMATTFADLRARDLRSLARSRELFEHNAVILDAAGEGICGLDIEGTVTFANPAAAAMTGYESTELVGRNLHATIHHSRHDGSPYPFAECPVSATLADGAVHRSEHDAYWRKNGSVFSVEVVSTPVFNEGLVTGAVAVFNDITERTAMEKQLRRSARYFELSRDLVCTVDRDGRFQQVNAAWPRILGWNENELLGRRPAEFVHPDDRVEAVRQDDRTAEDGFGEEFVNRYRTKQGEWRWLEWNLLAAPEDGLLYASARDVTERRATEVELAATHEKALEASRLKSEFLANMSHEIRTPLNGVIGMGQLLASTPLDEEQREYVDAVGASGEALMAVVNDILDFSKMEAGKLELDRHRFDLRALVEDVWLMLASTAHDKNLELVAWVAEDLPDAVHGDSVRVRQVLTNFATNAIKFTAAGDVVLRVTTEPLEDTVTAGVRFAVTDTGIGVEPGALERIFDAFSQADSSTTRRYGGTGLGLAISRQLVELMGGRIGVDSEPGVGSTFWFTVPLTAMSARGDARRRPDFAGARVLIVDENLTSRVTLDHQLSAWNLACDTAPDRGEAMRLLNRAATTGPAYALAVIDVRGPAVDGMLLARAIKTTENLRSTRLLMLSPSGSMREAATNSGIEGFLTKPARQSRLAQEIDRILRHSDLTPPNPRDRTSPTLPVAGSDGRSVLLAEDNTVNQLVAVRMLEQRGFRVDVASNGREAVGMHEAGDYDLIFMDCQMPELDGYAATSVIRQREASDRHTPIIALTAHTLEGDRDRCLAAGMDDYLSKPLRSGDLEQALARALAIIAGQSAREAPTATVPSGESPLLEPTPPASQQANAKEDEPSRKPARGRSPAAL